MFRILHFADLHLEMSFADSQLPASLGAVRRAGLRDTLGRILTLARERQVDAVTIAGDLYEQDYALPDTADFLVQQFGKLTPIRVFIVPGEHDPYTNDSLYALTRWPENVTVFAQGELSVMRLASDVNLWGAACPPARGRSALKAFRTGQQGVNLLLLHANELKDEIQLLFNVDIAGVRDAGFDLALLGHRHSGSLRPDSEPCCVYPGSPDVLTSGEEDCFHGVALIDIREGKCSVELLPTGQWSYRTLVVDLTGCDSTSTAAAQVNKALLTNPTGDDSRLICSVVLVGTLDFPLDVGVLETEVRTQSYLHYETRLSLAYDLDRLAQEQTVRGLLVRRFQAALAGAADDRERRALVNALNLALQSLDGKQVQPNEIG